jgi:transcriptional regulator with XRE-family HTH domain
MGEFPNSNQTDDEGAEGLPVNSIMARRAHSGWSARKRSELFPPNSIGYYIDKKGLSFKDLATATGYSRQQLQRLIERKRGLRPDNAAKIGEVLGVSAGDIGYSDAPDAYPWATRPIPLIGEVGDRMEISLCQQPHTKIGAYSGFVPKEGAAVKILASTRFMQLAEMCLFFDRALRERMTLEVLERQEAGTTFVVQLVDGSMWWRRIKPRVHAGPRNRVFHLEASNFETITDVEIEWVNEVSAIHPGRELPPSS